MSVFLPSLHVTEQLKENQNDRINYKVKYNEKKNYIYISLYVEFPHEKEKKKGMNK